MGDSRSAKSGHVLWPTPTLDHPDRRRTARAENHAKRTEVRFGEVEAVPAESEAF
ncbi:hypothetical protein [Piscibacillus halophilus]|uniref:hypothetical protein n=1 Tax=Piscibacillus halophilus TaxID=571933 RepID=UPI00240A851B|nr:hypothetical protein [Piscibacillus halophilus]